MLELMELPLEQGKPLEGNLAMYRSVRAVKNRYKPLITSTADLKKRP
jgi:hypothetical protein